MADLGSILGSAGIGGAIGKAIVSLELETTKYQAELKAANAQTTASANSMSSGFAKFGGIAKTAFLGVGAAAVAGLAVSVNAAIEANEAHLKLANTFKNNANLSDSSVEAFERQADSIRALTGVDDEAIISSQALLGAFELTGEEVQKLTPLIVDLSAKYGVDLDAAAKAVGKAIEGNTGSLARYGISLDDAAVDADAFAAVLEGLGSNAGFAAERAEAEPWRVLASEFEEVAESVGKVLLPVLQDLTGIVEALVPILQFVADNLDLVVIALAGFTAAKFVPELLFHIARGLEAIGAAQIASGLASVAAGMAGIAAGAVPVAAGFAAIVAAVALARDAFHDYSEAERVLIDQRLEARLANEEYTKTLDDVQRELGEAQQKAGLAAEGMLNLAGETANSRAEFEEAQTAIRNFAHLTDKELKEWKVEIGKSFDSAVFDLDNMAHQADVTRRQFIRAHEAMQDRARELARALREIAGEKWINDAYVKFLSEQGPEWLIGFTETTRREQRKAQEAWEETTKKTDAAKGSLDKITGALDELGKGKTRHEVDIHYTYSGFDPSKPGMSPPPGRAVGP